MPHKIIKIISLALIAATLVAMFVFPRPASAGDGDPRDDEEPKGCGTWNEWYGINGTQDAAGAYIGSVILYMGATCQGVGTLNFIIDGYRNVYGRPGYESVYHTISAGGTHTVTFFFDTGAGGQSYGPFEIAVNVYRPPSISGSVTCDQWGQNSWCIGNETLTLTASDPQGATVQISWDVAGYPYVRTDGQTSFEVPLPNGSGAINYLVRSMTTLTDSGSTSWALDNTLPQINGSLAGARGNPAIVPGADNWFTSNAVVSAAAADATSGLAGFDYSLDHAAYTAYTSNALITLSDGAHTITFRATDQAGNQKEVTQSINVDTITPVLDLSLSGTPGNNNWYTSNVQVSATASDSGSGLVSLEYALDGSAWTSYIGVLMLTDGVHSFSVRAIDAAGNVTQRDQQIYVDATTPLINLSVNGTPGAAGWYVSDIQVNASSADPSTSSGQAGSGLASFEYSLDDGAWSAYTSPLPYSEGQRSVQFRAADQAGNVTVTPAQAYFVDKTPPVIDLFDTLQPGVTEKYRTQDSISGVSGVRIVIRDNLERYPKVAWDDGDAGAFFVGEFFWDGRFADGTVAPAGDYFATLKAYDQAGNESMQTAIITVENSLFTYLIPRSAPPAIAAPALPTTLPALPSTDADFSGETVIEPVIPQTGTITTEESVFEPQPANLPGSQTTTNILWGVIAAAALGAVAADAVQKKSFGGETNQSISTQTSTITSGGLTAASAGAAQSMNFSTEPVTNLPTTNPLTIPGVMWGTAAAAAIGAFLSDAIAEQRRKWEEEREAKAALLKQQMEEAEAAEAAAIAARRAARLGDDNGGGHMTYQQIGQAYQASLNAFKAELDEAKAMGMSDMQIAALKQEVVDSGKIGVSLESAETFVKQQEEKLVAQNQWMEDKMANLDALDDAKWTASQAVIAEREKEAEAAQQKVLEDFRKEEQELYEQNLSDIACTPENAPKPKSGWEKLALWISGGFGAAQGVEDTVNAASVVARPLEGGYVGVSAPRSIRNMFGLLGTRYKPSTISLSSTGSSLIKSSAKNGAVAFNFGVSLLTNIYDYQWGEDKDTGVVSHEFGVSTIVDTVVATAVGIAAAALVAGVVAFLVGIGVLAATLSTPVLVGIAIATPVVAIGIGLGVDLGLEWPDKIIDAVNSRIDEWQGEPND